MSLRIACVFIAIMAATPADAKPERVRKTISRGARSLRGRIFTNLPRLKLAGLKGSSAAHRWRALKKRRRPSKLFGRGRLAVKTAYSNFRARRQARQQAYATAKTSFNAALKAGDTQAAAEHLATMRANRGLLRGRGLARAHQRHALRSTRSRNAYRDALGGFRTGLKYSDPVYASKKRERMRSSTKWYQAGRRIRNARSGFALRRAEKGYLRQAQTDLQGGKVLASGRMLEALSRGRDLRGAFRFGPRALKLRRLIKKANKVALGALAQATTPQSFKAHVALVQAFAEERGSALTSKQTLGILATAGRKGYALPADFIVPIHRLGAIAKAPARQLLRASMALSALGEKQRASGDSGLQTLGAMHGELAKAYRALAVKNHSTSIRTSWRKSGEANAAWKKAAAIGTQYWAQERSSNALASRARAPGGATDRFYKAAAMGDTVEVY